MTKLNFKDKYSEQRKKEELFIKADQEEMTDQSQIAGASIVEMAKRYGIDAIIAKAEQMNIDNNLKDKLYGYDLTNGFKSTEERLNIKKNLNNLFENIPARIRKEMFKDNIQEFLNAYTSNDEQKLTELSKVGIVSESQLEKVKAYNKKIKAEQEENNMRAKFIKELNKQEANLYDTFKTTGNININNSKNDTTGDKDI